MLIVITVSNIWEEILLIIITSIVIIIVIVITILIFIGIVINIGFDFFSPPLDWELLACPSDDLL